MDTQRLERTRQPLVVRERQGLAVGHVHSARCHPDGFVELCAGQRARRQEATPLVGAIGKTFADMENMLLNGDVMHRGMGHDHPRKLEILYHPRHSRGEHGILGRLVGQRAV